MSGERTGPALHLCGVNLADYLSALTRCALVVAETGQFLLAEQWFEEALEKAAKITALAPTNPLFRYELSVAEHRYGMFLMIYSRRPFAAGVRFQKAIDLLTKLLEQDMKIAYEEDLANSLFFRASCALAEQNLDLAAEKFREAEIRTRKLVQGYPNVSKYKERLLLIQAERALLRGKNADPAKFIDNLVGLKKIATQQLQQCRLHSGNRGAAGPHG